jgi:hypothetical protein
MAADNEGDPDAYSKGNHDHFGHAFGAKARRKVRSGSGTDDPMPFRNFRCCSVERTFVVLPRSAKSGPPIVRLQRSSPISQIQG